MLEKKIELAEIEPGIVAMEIGEFIVKSILEFGMSGGVVGLSGGVDSTLTAALAKQAFDRHNEQHPGSLLELVGYILPSQTNNPKDEEDGVAVAKKLGVRYEVKNIEVVVQAYRDTNPEAFAEGFHKGNLMSRIRANVLHTKSATEKKLVLGTGNRDEDFGIGYYTLFGDGAVHISPIGKLPKRLVRQMAYYLGFKEAAQREPTAGLENGQTDFKDLGYGYDAVEIVLEGIRQGFSCEEIVVHSQVRTLIEPQLIAYKARFGMQKFGSTREVVDDILNRHQKIALPKMRLVQPQAPDISIRYR